MNAPRIRSFDRHLRLFLGAVAAFAIFPACDGTPIDEPSTAPTTSADETPVALASLTLSTGQVIELFDLDGQAVVSESGEAGQPVVLDKMGEWRGNRLVNLWRSLAPDRAVPTAVASMQERLLRGDGPDLARAPKVRVAPEITGLEVDQVPAETPEGTLAAPVGCNNGCCDYEWLATFAACAGSGYDYQWFHYNYGWSSVKVYDASVYRTFACAAIGSSKFQVSVEGGGGGSWTLPERSYRTVRVVGPVCCNDPDISSKVNSQAAPALHTHCGALFY